MTGKKIMGYEMKEMYDVDTEEDFSRVDRVLRARRGGQQFVFDIDGVIATYRDDLAYDKAMPNQKMIDIINQLHDWGNRIVLYTARGYVTRIDWREVTEKQMADWGLKYDELLFTKPNGDFYVDDKMMDMAFLYKEFSK